jgi:hypothetical protein
LRRMKGKKFSPIKMTVIGWSKFYPGNVDGLPIKLDGLLEGGRPFPRQDPSSNEIHIIPVIKHPAGDACSCDHA